MNNTERPKVKPILQPIDYVLEIISIVGVISLWIQYVYYYKLLLDKIPVHFNFSGEADDWGSKNTLLVYPIIGTVLYVGFALLRKHPWLFNYPVPITIDNAERQYCWANRMLRFAILSVMLVENFIVFDTFQIAHTKKGFSGLWLILIIILGVLLPAIMLIKKSFQNK